MKFAVLILSDYFYFKFDRYISGQAIDLPIDYH